MIYILSGLIIIFLVIILIVCLKYNNMNKDKKVTTFLFAIAGIALIMWLLNKNKYKCPRCNYPLIRGVNPCPNCGQLIQWENK